MAKNSCVYYENGQCSCQTDCTRPLGASEKPAGKVNSTYPCPCPEGCNGCIQDEMPGHYDECRCTNPVHGGKLWLCRTPDCLLWPWR